MIMLIYITTGGFMSNIINLDESQYKDIDAGKEEIEQINEELEMNYEDINLIIFLINRILNLDNISSLPMYSSNYTIRFKENKEDELDKLYRLRIILKLYKENNKEEETHNSDFLNSISQLLNQEDNKDKGELNIKKTKEEINSIIIKNLINRFLKLHFKEKKSNLNERAKSDIEKTYGYYYWDKKKIARHLVTKEYTKILNDKYDMEYSKGKVETIPLAFYFDLSGSMNNYTTMLAQISYYLLKNKIKVLIGFNETIYYQIDDINNKNLDDLINFFENYNYPKNINYREVNENIDIYLKDKLCEKCVVFSDNDSYNEVCNLSKFSDVYLLYFETYGINIDEKFKGCVFEISNEEDLLNALRIISKTNYGVLKQKSLKLKRRSL